MPQPLKEYLTVQFVVGTCFAVSVQMLHAQLALDTLMDNMANVQSISGRPPTQR